MFKIAKGNWSVIKLVLVPHTCASRFCCLLNGIKRHLGLIKTHTQTHTHTVMNLHWKTEEVCVWCHEKIPTQWLSQLVSWRKEEKSWWEKHHKTCVCTCMCLWAYVCAPMGVSVWLCLCFPGALMHRNDLSLLEVVPSKGQPNERKKEAEVHPWCFSLLPAWDKVWVGIFWWHQTPTSSAFQRKFLTMPFPGVSRILNPDWE